ncbi:MAG: GNAT family N-acetyltransferase, partial [Eubacteriales bacterium]
MMTYRFAVPEDTDRLLAIYSQYIDTPITFEYALPTHDEFCARIKEISAFYPYLVALLDGCIIGYAYSHRAFERTAYQWDVEFSVYIDRNFLGRGIGTELYRRLIELSKKQKMRVAYARVTHPNERSDALHRSLGFEKLAVFPKTGYKNGE